MAAVVTNHKQIVYMAAISNVLLMHGIATIHSHIIIIITNNNNNNNNNNDDNSIE